MWGMATLAMEVSSASMKVARVTVIAMTQGLARGRQVSWNVSVAAAAMAGPREFSALGFSRRSGVFRRSGQPVIRLTLSIA
jgi:hypothetical protein